MRTDAEGNQAETQSHVDVEEDAQLVPSNNDPEPAKVQDVEPHQPVSEMPSEEKQMDEKQMTGETNFSVCIGKACSHHSLSCHFPVEFTSNTFAWTFLVFLEALIS